MPFNFPPGTPDPIVRHMPDGSEHFTVRGPGAHFSWTERGGAVENPHATLHPTWEPGIPAERISFPWP